MNAFCRSSITSHRLIGWALLSAYIVYFFALAGLKHLVQADFWATVVERWMLYSLTGAAMAVSIWIALGDGNGPLRMALGIWALIWVWIVWQGASYVAFFDRKEQPGSTTEGFSYYVVGQSVYALAIGVIAFTAARWLFGMQLIRPDKAGPLIPNRIRFTLAELVVAIAILAVTLATAKAIAPTDMTYLGWFARTNDNLGFLFNWTCASAIVLPTAIAISFYPRWTLPTVLYFTVAVVVVVAIPRWSRLSRIAFNSWWFFIRHEWLFYVVLVGHCVGIMLVMRWLGYRLVWRLRKNPSELRAPR